MGIFRGRVVLIFFAQVESGTEQNSMVRSVPITCSTSDYRWCFTLFCAFSATASTQGRGRGGGCGKEPVPI